ncbi:MAG: hypothetical protein AAF846_29545 [Chloroflexota bacterium]
MTRARFWITQFVWFLALIISGVAGSEGDGEVIPFVLIIAFLMTSFINRWGARRKASDETGLSYNGHLVARAMLTAFIWLMYIGGTVVAVTEVGGLGLLMALILMVPATAFTGLVWLWERINSIDVNQSQSLIQNAEKRKRQSMDGLLNKLSDDELYHLRQRLTEQTHQQNGVHGLTDDGELVYRQSEM